MNTIWILKITLKQNYQEHLEYLSRQTHTVGNRTNRVSLYLFVMQYI